MFRQLAFSTTCLLLAGMGFAEEADDKAFERKLSLQEISFHVQCPNAGSVNTLKITADGLEGSNAPIEQEIDGTVSNAEVADLNADGFPELYVHVVSAGSGGYGTLVAYASNSNKSLTSIYLPELSDDKKNSKGYMGHDEFAVVENVLARRFPVYKEGDSNAKPTGGTRQIQYKLKAGEAGWVLRVDKVTAY
jgi:hypothetical protein